MDAHFYHLIKGFIIHKHLQMLTSLGNVPKHNSYSCLFMSQILSNKRVLQLLLSHLPTYPTTLRVRNTSSPRSQMTTFTNHLPPCLLSSWIGYPPKINGPTPLGVFTCLTRLNPRRHHCSCIFEQFKCSHWFRIPCHILCIYCTTRTLDVGPTALWASNHLPTVCFKIPIAPPTLDHHTWHPPHFFEINHNEGVGWEYLL